MSLRGVLLASALSAGFSISSGSLVSAASIDTVETAYIEALRVLGRVQGERSAATDRLDRVRTARAVQQADIDARREAATSDTKRNLSEKQAILEEFLRQPPSINTALEQANAEVAKARQAAAEAETRLKQYKAAVVEAQSASSVFKVNVDRAKVRIDGNREEITKEQARIKRIENGDAGELDELAKRAVQEKEDIAAILRDFEPAFQAAQRTARIAVGMHLPALYKAKQAVAQIKTNFCGQYTEHSRQHIDYALQGIESFLGDANSLAGVYLDMAKRHEPKEADATCSHNLAETGIVEARQRIKERESKIADDERAIAAATGQLTDAAQILATAKEQIGAAESQVRAATDAAQRLDRDLAAQKAVWDAAAEQARQQRNAQEEALRAEVAEAQRAYDAALSPFLAEAERLPSLKEPVDQVADLAKALSEAETETERARDAFLAELLRTDVDRLVRVQVQSFRGYLGRDLCGWLENSSPFAIRSVTFRLTLGGRPLPDGISFTPAWSTSMHEIINGAPAGATAVDVGYRTDAVTFSKTNRYSENVPYLMPGARSRSVCVGVEDLFKGNNLRVLEGLGYGRESAPFGLRIDRFTVADGSVSADSRGATALGSVNLAQHYRSRLDQAKARAMPAVTAPKPQSDPAIVPAKAVTEDGMMTMGKAEASKAQQVLISVGLLTGKADGTLGEKSREAIRKWQAANGLPATGQLTVGQFQALTGR